MDALKKKVSAVEGLIEKEVPILEAAMKNLAPQSTVKDVAASVDSIRERELQKALAKLGLKDKKRIQIIEELTKSNPSSDEVRILQRQMRHKKRTLNWLLGQKQRLELVASSIENKSNLQPDTSGSSDNPEPKVSME